MYVWLIDMMSVFNIIALVSYAVHLDNFLPSSILPVMDTVTEGLYWLSALPSKAPVSMPITDETVCLFVCLFVCFLHFKTSLDYNPYVKCSGHKTG